MRNELNMQLLEQFVVLARTKNFTRAAEELHLSQSSLSRAIQKLEDQFGQPLFERRPRELVLTDAGEIMLDRAKSILYAVEDLFCEVSQVGRKKRVRLGAIPTIAPYFLPHFLGEYRKRHPDVSVIVQEDTTEHLIKRCEHGEIDVVILALPVESPHLRVEAMFDEELLLVLPVDHELAKRKKIRPADVEEYPFVMLNEAHCLTDNIASFCRRKFLQPVTIERTSQLTTVQELVALGHGVSVVPAMARKIDLSDRRLYRSFEGDAPQRTVAMMWNDHRAQPEHLKVLLSALKKHGRGI
jgi:LysR family transcriptional regulator, hydrogen peroxide-inducible genes activator